MFRDARAIGRVLRRRYDEKTLDNKHNPFDELLYIILSSKTPPGRYRETYRTLRKRFPRADALAHTTPRVVAKTVERGGLARRRGTQIVAIAKQLEERFGRVTLAPLGKMDDREAETLLTSLPGVGIKIARCVLLFALHRKVFPVDAHCFRIATRMGWVREGVTLTDGVADEIQDGIPADLRRHLHVSFVLLGRQFCTPSTPRCCRCPIARYCDTGRARIGARSQPVVAGKRRRLQV
jgi:endonuclease III